MTPEATTTAYLAAFAAGLALAAHERHMVRKQSNGRATHEGTDHEVRDARRRRDRDADRGGSERLVASLSERHGHEETARDSGRHDGRARTHSAGGARRHLGPSLSDEQVAARLRTADPSGTRVGPGVKACMPETQRVVDAYLKRSQ